MLNSFDKTGMSLIAGGVLGQFFDPDTDTKVAGCTAEHNSTGTWTITLPNGVLTPNYIFTASALTGFNPGIIIEMQDIDETHKFVYIKNSNTGASIDVSISFMLYEIISTRALQGRP